MTTGLTCWGHACVRLERDGDVLVVDPGGWSDLAVLEGADAVLVTHVHPDHLAVEALVEALHERPLLHVWGPGTVVTALRDAGAPEGRVVAAAPGEAFEAGGFAVEVLGGEHAPIHPDVPGTANLAYLVDGAVLHPGDSFTRAGREGVSVLLAPVGGPWLRIADTVDLARAVRAGTVVPIHDAVLSEQGRGLVDRVVGGLVEGYLRLDPGDVLELG